MKFASIFDAHKTYLEANQDNNHGQMLTTIFVRFLIPYWGGISPKGKRATNQEIETALNFTKTLPIKHLSGISDISENIFSAQEIPLENRRPFRYELKNFLSWLESKDDKLEINSENYEVKASETSDKAIRFSSKRGQARRDWRKLGNHGKSNKIPWTLCAKNTQGQLIYPDDYINPLLKSDLEEFEKFRYAQNCSKGTVNGDIAVIRRILGWMHRFKNIPLEELRITSIVPFCRLNIPMEDADYDINKYLGMERAAKQKGREVGKKVLNLANEYMEFLNGHPVGATIVLKTIVATAKFIYKDEIGTDEYPTQEHIPVIKQLNVLTESISKKAKRAKPTVPFENKSVNWETAFNVLERLRIESETTVGIGGDRRKENGQINSLQDFLSLAFLILIPPLRSRVYYELEIGRTLVKGIYKNNTFISEKRLADPTLAFWYIHLQSDDYKTGKTYGEWWGLVPNVTFIDGKRFYDYIDKWLTECRNSKKQCNHNYFFMGKQNNEQLNTNKWYTRIVSIFNRLTGVPVSPKEFRKMYITYAKSKGMTLSEREAMALRMQHSVQMGDTIYDQQTQVEKAAPIEEFNARIFEEVQSKENNLIPPEIAAKPAPPTGEQFTNLKLSRAEAAEKIKRLQTMGMNQEQIISFLWDVTPKTRKKYQDAVAEMQMLLGS